LSVQLNIFKIKRSLFLIAWLVYLPFFAQDKTIDSLKLALKTAAHDTVRCEVLTALAESAPDGEWEKYNEQLKIIAEKNIKTPSSGVHEKKLFKKYYATSLSNMGGIYHSQGHVAKALEFYQESLKIQEEVGDKKGVATTFNNIGFIYYSQSDINKALEYYHKSLKMLEELGDKNGIAHLLNNIGAIYDARSNAAKALEYYNRSVKIREEIGDKKGIASTLGNIGYIYESRGDINKALECFSRSLKIQESTGDKKGVANSLHSIGHIYSSQGDIVKALEYYTKGLKIQEEIGNKRGISDALNSIAVIYTGQGDIDRSLEYHIKSLKIQEEIGEKKGIALALLNVGIAYIYQVDPSVQSPSADELRIGLAKALEYINRSLKIYSEIEDKKGIAACYMSIGAVYMAQKKYEKTLQYYLKSMKLNKELGYPEPIRNSAKRLAVVYKGTGQYKLALENYELYIQMRDSINNQSTRKASIKSQLKYEYEKQAAADSVAHAKENEIKSAELSRQAAEIKAKKNQQYALFGGLLLVCLFGVFMFNRYKVTQKQKRIIEDQKDIVETQKKLVEEKQHEILDSIKYAKRIQMAQIPSEKMVTTMLMRTKIRK
jgi:tetratricopeptide (TPR) repeat protein